MTLRDRIARGAGWAVASAGLGRLIQFFTAALTTRWLMPDEFGLWAVATAATLFLERVTTFSIGSALVREDDYSRSKLDVAWSYQVLRGVLLCLITVAAAPALAAAFGEPKATDLLRVSALTLAITAFRNIGLISLYRALNFRALCQVELFPIAVHAVVAIGATWWLRSIWALVIAGLVSGTASVISSYGVAPHWPRFNCSWTVARPLFVFSLFLLGNNLLQTLREQGAVFILARGSTLEELGYYNRATAFSLVLVTQAWALFWRVSYPVFAQLQREPERLRRTWQVTTKWLAAASFVGLGAYLLVSPYLLGTLLDTRWMPIVPLIQVFCLHGFLRLVTAAGEVVFQAVGRPGLGTCCDAIATLVVLVGIPWLLRKVGLIGVPWAFVAGQACIVPLVLLTCDRLLRKAASSQPAAQPVSGPTARISGESPGQ